MTYQYALSSFPGVDPTGAVDSTAAINAAIASLTHADILVDGTYKINNTGIIGKSKISLISNRKGAGVLKAAPQTFSPSAGLFNGGYISDFYLGGVVFDWSLAVNSSLPSVISLGGCSRFEIENCEIDGQFIFGIGINFATDFKIKCNRISLTAASASQNQGILISSASGGSSNGWVDENTLINTALDVEMKNASLRGNNISSWKFGAGITTELTANCANLEIIDNMIANGSGTDVNGNTCEGIENWAPRAFIHRNKVSGCAGDGIDNGGQNSVVSGNIVYNNGTVAGSGIASRYADTTHNANFSIYDGNQCFDLNGTSGTQSYGYLDQSASLSGVVLVNNNFMTNKTGPTHVLGSGYINANNKIS